MVPPESNYSMTATEHSSDVAEASENDLKTNFMKMIDVFKRK